MIKNNEASILKEKYFRKGKEDNNETISEPIDERKKIVDQIMDYNIITKEYPKVFANPKKTEFNNLSNRMVFYDNTNNDFTRINNDLKINQIEISTNLENGDKNINNNSNFKKQNENYNKIEIVKNFENGDNNINNNLYFKKPDENYRKIEISKNLENVDNNINNYNNFKNLYEYNNKIDKTQGKNESDSLKISSTTTINNGETKKTSFLTDLLKDINEEEIPQTKLNDYRHRFIEDPRLKNEKLGSSIKFIAKPNNNDKNKYNQRKVKNEIFNLNEDNK